MRYTVELYSQAVSCGALAGRVARTVFSHIENEAKSHTENLKNRMDLAHLWLNSKDISKPFLLDTSLYYPITVVTGGQSVVYGYLCAVVSVNNPPLLDLRLLSTPEDAAKEGLKLSAQIIKLIKGSEVSKKMLTTANWQAYSYNRRHSRGGGFKCKPEEIIKSLALGYLKIDTNETGVKQVLNHINRPIVPAPSSSTGSGQATKVCNTVNYTVRGSYSCASSPDPTEPIKIDPAPKVSHTYYDEDKLEDKNEFFNFIQVCTGAIQRTSLEVDPRTEMKWRKASKNSLWPYTLDHHWFNAQEGRISVAHHAFKSLMHGPSYTTNRGTSSEDKLQVNLPIFTCIKTLDRTRKILEHFFSNTSVILGDKANHAYSRFISAVNDLEWPMKRYSHKIVSPEMFPVMACLALEVMPAFDQSGQFMKFLPIDNTLSDNKQLVYYEIDPHNLSTRRPEVTFLLAYSTGLITIEDLETVLGINRHTTMADTKGYVHLHLSKNIVLCFPIEYALNEAQISFNRQNLVMYPEAESREGGYSSPYPLIVKALDQVDELDAYNMSQSDD